VKLGEVGARLPVHVRVHIPHVISLFITVAVAVGKGRAQKDYGGSRFSHVQIGRACGGCRDIAKKEEQQREKNVHSQDPKETSDLQAQMNSFPQGM